MPTINFSEETDELVYVIAAVGKVTNPLNLPLYEKLCEHATVAEIHRAEALMERIEFSWTRATTQ